MPVMDGYEATRRLRRQSRFSELPILAMTANAMAGDRERVIESGMNDHIAKPINIHELFHTMARWITPSTPAVSAPAGVAEQVEAEIPELDGIHTAEGLARVQGNSKLYLQLLRKMRDSQAGFSGEFAAAVQAGDWELAERLAHTLKGVAGNVGAQALQAACEALEAETKRGTVEPKTVGKMNEELSRVLNSLATLGEPEPVVDNAPLDGAAVRVVLEKLAKQLHAFDTAALETLEMNRTLLSAAELTPRFRTLEKALQRYDFDAAMVALKKVRAEVPAATVVLEVDRGRIAEVLDRLASMIDDYNTEALTLFEAEEPLLVAAGLGKAVSKLRKALATYDFDTAKRVLPRLDTGDDGV